MAAYYDDNCGTVRRYHTRTWTVTATATNATSIVVYYDDWPEVTAATYTIRTVVETVPPPPPDYVALLPVVWPDERGGAQLPIGRSVHAKLARGKLKRWKSLKEKRQAWAVCRAT